MSKSTSGVRRLAELYSVVEGARGAAMQRAAGALAETEAEINELKDARLESHAQERRALAHGDRLEWMVADSRSRIIAREQELSESQRIVRKRLLDCVTEEYRISRIDKDQMNNLLENLQQQEAVLEARRIQSSADDRFLSRRTWKQQSSARTKHTMRSL